MTTDRGHEFIEVANRRWCSGCRLFQQRFDDCEPFPVPRNDCDRSTPYADEKRRQSASAVCGND